ncbi:MAG: hypothetical protein KCCBMMGE_00297 [Candidatus Methanoperedenaceae archaeon GB37]|nr:MAG: hypothetical protein KCCBMMGE_00297 [Candidatus Methanoperedenaceae archaeon GB37]
MLGKRNPQEPLFYYFNMADMIPKNHILRLINKCPAYRQTGIRNKVKHLYSDMGRPSIDPEALIRMLLIGYLDGITTHINQSSHQYELILRWVPEVFLFQTSRPLLWEAA